MIITLWTLLGSKDGTLGSIGKYWREVFLEYYWVLRVHPLPGCSKVALLQLRVKILSRNWIYLLKDWIELSFRIYVIGFSWSVF